MTSTPARVEHNNREQSIEEIRQNIEHTRSEITDTVDLLSEKLKQTFDWRQYIKDNPVLAVGGAALIGFYLTRKLIGPQRSTTEDLLQNLIKTANNALRPQKALTVTTVLGLLGKFALDKYQKYQEEQEQQRQWQEQMEQLQALQLMQNPEQHNIVLPSQHTQHKAAGS